MHGGGSWRAGGPAQETGGVGQMWSTNHSRALAEEGGPMAEGGQVGETSREVGTGS